MDQYLPDAGLLKRPAQRRRLDKLGPRPYDGDNLQHEKPSSDITVKFTNFTTRMNESQ